MSKDWNIIGLTDGSCELQEDDKVFATFRQEARDKAELIIELMEAVRKFRKMTKEAENERVISNYKAAMAEAAEYLCYEFKALGIGEK